MKKTMAAAEWLVSKRRGGDVKKACRRLGGVIEEAQRNV